VLLSSHVLPEVERICDRIAIIRRGELVDVDTMEQLKAKAVRHLEILFEGNPPVEQLQQVPGVVSVTTENSTARVAVSGSISALIRMLAQYEVVDLSSGSQALEDQFMSFYDGSDEEEQS
ncbi:MAG: ABC transporter ATP-binding protein, partial [Chloroflexi bacterium]|nr:ABC transporter ATP-binding protein [Chloroflexota bacterium]